MNTPELLVPVFEFKEDANGEETLLTATARLPNDVNEKGEGANEAKLLTGTNNERLIDTAMMNCWINCRFTQKVNTNEPVLGDDGVLEWQRRQRNI